MDINGAPSFRSVATWGKLPAGDTSVNSCLFLPITTCTDTVRSPLRDKSSGTCPMFEFKDGPTAQWRPDPFGRYELRRFFLGAPTSLVKSGEILGYDQIDVEVPAEAPLHTAPQVPPVPPVQVPSAPAMEEPHVPLAPAAAFAAGPT
ncbi:MAG TPA: hypothetical protein VN768_06075, partial [Acidimicrobiales bacterium]|nr:hypothetical protein [Acidimicrobiales bacterium]